MAIEGSKDASDPLIMSAKLFEERLDMGCRRRIVRETKLPMIVKLVLQRGNELPQIGLVRIIDGDDYGNERGCAEMPPYVV